MSDADERDDLPEPPSHEDIDARLQDAKRRIEQARNKPKPTSKGNMDLDPETSRGTGLGLAAAYAIIGLPLAGALGGYFLDQQLGTKNVAALIGVLLGGILGVGHAMRLASRQK
jgi:F0F1-type ATP synthase assembly protein I